MPIPEFYHFLRPTLQLHSSEKTVAIAEVREAMAGQFLVTPEEQQTLLPSGRITRFSSRVHWALTYLRQALLLKSEGRGLNKITNRGKQYLLDCPALIKPNDLLVFPEYAAFQSKQNASSTVPVSLSQPQTAPEYNDGPALTEQAQATPEENINASYQVVRDTLAQEVLERVKSMPPAFFEKLIVQLMLRLGYGGGLEEAGKTLGKSGDGGVDGVIYEDKLGLDKIYLQAKRWNGNPVGVGDVHSFVGALSSKGALKGVFITASTFTQPARNTILANHTFKVSLVDGIELAKLMIDYDLGVSLVQRYDVRRIDSDFFAEQ